MSSPNLSAAQDTLQMRRWLSEAVDSSKIAEFVPGPGIARLDLRFDIERLREALNAVLGIVEYQGDGFHAIPVTRRPGTVGTTANDLSGRYYIRPDATYTEVAREDIVDEHAFTEFVPELQGTYFEEVYESLTARFRVGRMRILMKPPMTCNSWHRDPEPRIHIPVHSNPGAVFIVNHHCTHLPADGSVYFTDTRGYHCAINGGEHPRVHIVAALPQ